VDTAQGVVTLAGTLSNSTATTNYVKTGRGTLVLSGVNTQANTNTGDGNYGRSLFIDSGIVSVSADANLGRTTVIGGSQSHQAGLPGDILLRGGVLRVDGSFATTRQFQFTVASGIDVTAGNTFTINPLTGSGTIASFSGAFGLTKTGNGVLALNPLTTGTLNNTNNSLTIGGAPLATAANQTSGVSGGTVSTTATGGNVFGTGAVNLNGGVLALNGGTAAQAVTLATVNFGGGSYVQLSGSVSTSTLTATALNRDPAPVQHCQLRHAGCRVAPRHYGLGSADCQRDAGDTKHLRPSCGRRAGRQLRLARVGNPGGRRPHHDRVARNVCRDVPCRPDGSNGCGVGLGGRAGRAYKR
jgi:hypothetical protein